MRTNTRFIVVKFLQVIYSEYVLLKLIKNENLPLWGAGAIVQHPCTRLTYFGFGYAKYLPNTSRNHFWVEPRITSENCWVWSTKTPSKVCASYIFPWDFQE